MTISEKLVILRKKAAMTQDDLAKALAVSRQSIHKWEAGICYPEATKLIGLKAIFSISIDDLLDDSVDVALPEKKRKVKAKEEVTVEENAPMEIKEENTPVPVLNSEVEAEPIAEEITVEVIEAPVVEAGEEKVEEVKSAPVKTGEEEEKKKGFFSKLCGRK